MERRDECNREMLELMNVDSKSISVANKCSTAIQGTSTLATNVLIVRRKDFNVKRR